MLLGKSWIINKINYHIKVRFAANFRLNVNSFASH